MKKIWIFAGALGLCGCASNSETAPVPTAVVVPAAVVQPQVTPTPAFAFLATATPIPPAIENSAPAPVANATSTGPSASEQEEKREKVRSLRYDISVMENQKRALTQRKEDMIKDGHPNHPDAGPNYDENMKQRNDTIERKQKEIDDIMLSP